jgi:putative flippase GtrA
MDHRNFPLYFAFSVIAFSIDIACFAYLVQSIDYRLAVFLSFLTAAVVKYKLCDSFAFRRETGSFSRFLAASTLGLAVNEVVMIIYVELLGGTALVFVKVIAGVAGFIVTYLGVKKYAFR